MFDHSKFDHYEKISIQISIFALEQIKSTSHSKLYFINTHLIKTNNKEIGQRKSKN
jgi:hypothetical protein